MRVPSTVRFLRDGVRINLGGIAKGYVVERGVDLLRLAGVEHAIVSAGGDSGSLIVAHDVDEEGVEGEKDRRPVGLLFAGDGSLTIGNPIGTVLDAFGVRIVGDR